MTFTRLGFATMLVFWFGAGVCILGGVYVGAVFMFIAGFALSSS